MLGLKDSQLSRLVSAFSCSYLLWAFFALWRQTQTFRSLVAGLGAEAPASTAFLFNNYVWLYPLLYLAIVAGLVGQEFFLGREQARLSLTLILSLLALFLVDFLKSLLFLPLFTLIHQLT
jgi:hypothetical protein